MGYFKAASVLFYSILTEMCRSDVSGRTNNEERDHEQLQLLHKPIPCSEPEMLELF